MSYLITKEEKKHLQRNAFGINYFNCGDKANLLKLCSVNMHTSIGKVCQEQERKPEVLGAGTQPLTEPTRQHDLKQPVSHHRVLPLLPDPCMSASGCVNLERVAVPCSSLDT